MQPAHTTEAVTGKVDWNGGMELFFALETSDWSDN